MIFAISCHMTQIHIYVIVIMAHKRTISCLPLPSQFLRGFELFARTILQLGESLLRGVTMVWRRGRKFWLFKVRTSVGKTQFQSLWQSDYLSIIGELLNVTIYRISWSVWLLVARFTLPDFTLILFVILPESDLFYWLRVLHSPHLSGRYVPVRTYKPV